MEQVNRAFLFRVGKDTLTTWPTYIISIKKVNKGIYINETIKEVIKGVISKWERKWEFSAIYSIICSSALSVHATVFTYEVRTLISLFYNAFCFFPLLQSFLFTFILFNYLFDCNTFLIDIIYK